MTKQKRFRNTKHLSASRALLAAGWGILIILIIVLVFSFVLTKIDLPEGVVSAVTAAALCIGAYCGGFICARRNRRNGLLLGAVCGSVIFLVLFVVSIIFVRSSEGLAGSTKLIFVVLCGAVGGIAGVNSKNSRF